MPITAALAVPYSVMKDYLHGNPTNRIVAISQNFDRVWIISITNPFINTSTNNCVPLIHEETEDRIALQFSDLDGNEEDRHPDSILFNKDMAEKIVGFLKEANSRDSNDLLVVNCHMGISRSGAVSWFARSVFGIDYSDWKRQNRQVIPNNLVLELLYHAWGNNQV